MEYCEECKKPREDDQHIFGEVILCIRCYYVACDNFLIRMDELFHIARAADNVDF